MISRSKDHLEYTFFPSEVGESRDILASKVVETLLDLKKSRSLRLKMIPDLFSNRPDVRIVGIVDPLGYLAHACSSFPNGSSTLLFLIVPGTTLKNFALEAWFDG